MNKKLKHIQRFSIITTLLFTVILTACGNEPEPIVFTPVTLPGFEIELETFLSLQSDSFTLQGNLIEDSHLEDEALMQLLEELEIDIPDIPDTEFIFELELISYEFTQDDDEDEVIYPKTPPVPSTTQIQISNEGIARFSHITFDYAGVFTYHISQLIDTDSDQWSLPDSNVTIVVTVTENLETESLEVRVGKTNHLVFENIFTYNISETVRIIITEQWEIRVAQAYEEGYEYVENEDGEYERVAIYVPTEPPTEAPTEAATNPPVADAPTPPANSGIPENYAVTISNADALSYLALVNRHFRVCSSFSPGDLSVVNVRSTHGTHSLRASAARALENLFQSATDNGHTLVATSGYRSYWTQQATHNHFIASMGEAEARRVSARPGHSEHQLGLAIDITTPALGTTSFSFSYTAEGTWVRENAHHFGFIIRYPAGREADTGFVYEPWHLRFIGVDAATQMFGSGLILEEFLGAN